MSCIMYVRIYCGLKTIFFIKKCSKRCNYEVNMKQFLKLYFVFDKIIFFMKKGNSTIHEFLYVCTNSSYKNYFFQYNFSPLFQQI